jgi:uracil-DNA glycosylase
VSRDEVYSYISDNFTDGVGFVKMFGEIDNGVASCKFCSLGNQPRRILWSGTPKAKFFFLGESPNIQEEMSGEPFSSKSGLYLKKLMFAAGFRKGDVFMTYCVKCRPPKSRQPTPEEVGHCSTWVLRQLDAISPSLVVAVGSVAFDLLCRAHKGRFGSCRGEVFSGFGYRVFPVWHPAFVLSSGQSLRGRELLKDLKRAYNLVYNEQ